jgi:hypothetical protein
MITDLLSELFTAITEIECWDMDDSNCIEGVQMVIASISNSFYGFAGAITLVFLLLTALPKYTYRWSFLNDIIMRRFLFLAGLGLSIYVLMASWDAALGLCALRDDSDTAMAVFEEQAGQARAIAMCIYPVTFLVLAVLLDKLLRRRKLMTVFRSNNKIFGLI